MGEEESANVVANTDSNGNNLPGKTLNDMSEKKDLEADQGKALGDNGVKDLKEDDIKEMEEDKKAGGELKDDNKVGGGEEVKEDKEVYSVEGKEDGKKDDNISGNEKLNEGTEVKETVGSKEEKGNIEAKKPELDAKEAIGVCKGKDEGSEKEKIQVEEKDEDKVDKPKEEEKIEDSKIDKGLKKIGKGKNIREKAKSKGNETVDSKGEKENVEAKKPDVGEIEEAAVPEDKDESSEKNKIQEKKDGDKVNKSKEEENVDDSKVKKGQRKRGKGKITGEKVKRKGKDTVDSEKEKESVEAKKPELDAMEEEGVSKDKEESSEKEKIQEEEEEEDTDKGSKKRGNGKINREKVEKKRKVLKETEPRTPAIIRPTRERKTVERLVASIEKDANKELHIAKGNGTPLKDIPNVAFKLARRKIDDTLKLLHTILFGRRGKAIQVKNNISRFSGFVWHENEEKQIIKVKEKLDRCNKEKLFEFCDLLDIQIARSTIKKEDIIAKLVDFLVAPQATTDVLLAEKEKLIKGKKRKSTAKRSSRSGTTSSGRAAKSRKKIEGSSVAEERKSTTDTEDESEVEGKDEEPEKNDNGAPDKSEDEVPEKSESEEKGDSDNESQDVKNESAAKSKIPKNTVTTKPRSVPKRTSKKSSATGSEFDDGSDASPKVSSRKKKIENEGKQKISAPNKSSSKEKTEKVTKGKGKSKEKVDPSDDQLRDAICEILKNVDFNTATFTDILKQLAKQFDVDLTPRKASIKIIIQEELTKLAEEAEDEEDEDAENAENAED
ncbi:PREDICTED: uncharacterized protein DDB_G0286299-like isoform X3 [Lupinus angustifolius]|uniref:uncharacterized protein DDB_G0286299-like isoform X3 n=1 Tax=Lupinus angustifolius TaxID=3871 RepID=UPI00092E3E1F|nr:PREDICTED: uncharacterized protein DDB_G0286299-like isoform X3 [Lupinus angustifolius]